MTIAGFDPSGGAGIIADVRTIAHFGCLTAGAITSLTFQNSSGVFGVTHETAKSLRAQIVPVISEQKPATVKIGMLPTAELVFEIASLIREGRLPAPILDPVFKSSSGYDLMEPDAVRALKTELLPLARLITPNIPEAEVLTGVAISDQTAMARAAAKLREMGAPAVLVKGGHSAGELAAGSQEPGRKEAVDVLDDDGEVTVFRTPWIEAHPVRGTGCMLSSAIAALIANGADLISAVDAAKKYVAAEIQNSSLKIQK